MRKIKKKYKIFLKSFYLSSLIIFCIIFGFLGISRAYENIRMIGFGEYRSAIEIKDGEIKIFDFCIEIEKYHTAP